MRRLLRGRLALIVLLLAAGGSLLGSSHTKGGSSAPAAPSGKWKTAGDFLRAHWAYPLPPMGEAPASYQGEERSLLPEACGKCHEEQYRQWRTSLHAKAMGPGVYGQLVDLWASDPGEARGCNECHAPLAEQQKRLPRGEGPSASWQPNPSHLPALEMAGLACAACHVRGWRVHGPPKRETPEGRGGATLSGKHGGAERTPFFEGAEFCMKCHQHEGSGPAGKPIQNTFREWRESLWGEEGVPCQSCHMPRREHLWRGIHDKDMAQGAVGVEVEVGRAAPGVAAARIVLTNTGAGHHFPTYITPSVDVVAELEDEAGKAIPGTRQAAVIGRRLSEDFAREVSDTRIPAQQSFVMDYRQARPAGAARLRVRVRVKPDHFYHGFFEAYLKGGGLSPQARKLIEEARDNAAKSAFDIYDERFALP